MVRDGKPLIHLVALMGLFALAGMILSAEIPVAWVPLSVIAFGAAAVAVAGSTIHLVALMGLFALAGMILSAEIPVAWVPLSVIAFAALVLTLGFAAKQAEMEMPGPCGGPPRHSLRVFDEESRA